jgi:hypothetical protein
MKEEKMIGKIFHYIRGKREVIHAFHESTQYMSAGIYVFDDSVKYITRMDPAIKDKASRVFQKNEYKKRSTRWLIFLLKQTIFRKALSISRNDLSNQEFTGNVYLPVGSSNGYKDKKIFDLENNKVLTIFFDQREYQSVLTNYEHFKDYFPIPNIIWTNSKKSLMIEELIFFHPVNHWKEEDFLFVMEDIFIRYLHYLRDCKTIGGYSSEKAKELVKTLPNCEEIVFIQNQINPELWEMEIPTLKLHGDLWAANTLLIKGEENQVKYIDWEFSKELFFFYDFFNMMWLDVYMKNRFFLVNGYVNGDYDQYFKSIFSLFDLTFYRKYRMDYFHLYFLNFFKERLVHFAKADRQIYFQQYKRLVETLER